jgi:CHAD domain-containing protein
MEMVLSAVQKPVRRLRKALKCLPPDPSIEDVHNLRTRMRRVEAITTVLRMGDEKPAQRLLKTIKTIHKALGAVRDMDVMAGNVLTLERSGHDESALRLLQHLHGLRIERVRHLVDAVGKHRKDARRSLKRFSGQIEKWFKESKPGAANGHVAARLLGELRHWPALDAGNLHAFRIKVKELRYVLQLARSADSGLVAALDQARAQIGDWHDWQQLASTAEKTLAPETDSAALKQIAEIEKRKFSHALRAAEEIKAFPPGLPKPVRAATGFAVASRVA